MDLVRSGRDVTLRQHPNLVLVRAALQFLLKSHRPCWFQCLQNRRLGRPGQPE